MPKIKFPIEVSGIDFEVDKPITNKSWQAGENPVGSFVSVRSCLPEHGNKTYLGIVVGWVPSYTSVRYDKETKKLAFQHSGDNPAIFVPDLKQTILGCESWWGSIESEKELREITDNDIQNVWYVKAMKALADEKKSADTEQGGKVKDEK